MKRPRRLPAFALVTGLLFPQIAAAEEDRSVVSQAPPALPGLFGEVLDVRVINLEVTVTDKEGTPIFGLGTEDFALVVDDQEVQIDYFSEIRGGVVLDTTSETMPGVPALAPGQPVGTSYLVFIDEFFGLPRDRNNVLNSLKEDLGFLGPRDRMAIVAYDGEKLDMLSTWSQSQVALERTLNDAMTRPSHGLRRAAERRQLDFNIVGELEQLWVDQLNEEESIAVAMQLEPQERTYVEGLTGQVNRAIAAAAATLRSFAKPPGRKVMILLSGDWPFVPVDFLVGDVSRTLFERDGPYGANLFKRLVEVANLLGYTLYPVDMPGLEVASVGADTAGRPTSSANFSPTVLREQEAQATLRYLAQETGGRALINAQRLDALELVRGDIESYYWLGFTPTRDRDDVSHDVRIRLENPDLVARSRRSFLDSSRETEVSMAVESTLLFGNAAAGSLDVEIGAPVKAGKKRMELEIKVAVPLDEVTILPIAGGFGTQLELRVAVQDEDGKQVPIPVVPWSLTFDAMPPANSAGIYKTRLVLRNKAHQAVVAVHDPASGRLFTTGFDIPSIDK